MEEVCQLATELFNNSEMDSVPPNTGTNMPCSSKEPATKDILDSSLESDLGIGPVSIKTDTSNPSTNQNGLDDSVVYDETSDNLLEDELQVLFSDSDDLPIDFADERPPSDDDEPFEIEDLISSSDEDFLEFSAQDIMEEQQETLPKAENLDPAVIKQVNGDESVKKSEEISEPVTADIDPPKDEVACKTESEQAVKPKKKKCEKEEDGQKKVVTKKKKENEGEGEKKPKKGKAKKKSEGQEDGDSVKKKPKSRKKKETVEGQEDKPKPKRKRKKKGEGDGNETGEPKEKKTKKRKKKEATEGDDSDDDHDAKKRKNNFERKNIRKIMEEEKVNEDTKSAQKLEQERIQRLLKIQEQILAQQVAMKKQREEEERKRRQEEMETFEKLKQSELKTLLAAEDPDSPPSHFLNRRLLNHQEEIYGAIPASSKRESGGFLDSVMSNDNSYDAAYRSPDVVEILSSSEDEAENDLVPNQDSQRDVVVLKSEEEEDEEDDPSNCGSHVNDALNQPDDQGRVLVNVGHPDNEEDLFLPPQIAANVKAHQIGGIRFLYDNLVESIQQYKNSNGFGCILAHSMGLGKTIQMISFIEVFLRSTTAKCVLVIVPINTLQNWMAEFNMWLPTKEAVEEKRNEWKKQLEEKLKAREERKKIKLEKDKLENGAQNSDKAAIKSEHEMDSFMDFLSSIEVQNEQESKTELKTEGKEEENDEIDEKDPFEQISTRSFPIHIVNDNLKTNAARGRVVDEWYRKGGVLLMGYEMYRLLTSRRVLNTKPRRTKKTSNDPVVIDLEEEDRKAELMINLQEALIRPGPDLVICDEGHRIKNSHASISQALKNIKTKRRVVLTGYPLQNNLVEYWCMVDFVRPNYLGSKTEFTNMFERPITNGQCMDSTPQDVRLMKFRAHVLHSLLEGFVQRRGHGVLKLSLPEKEEYVLLVRMSAIQRKLYALFMGIIEDGFSEVTNNNPLKAFAVCCKIWNHPDVLNQFVEEHRNTAADDDLDIALDEESRTDSIEPNASKKPKSKVKKVPKRDSDQPPMFDKKDTQISYDWALDLMKSYRRGVIENGGKMLLLMSMIEKCLEAGDKLLVFSQSLFTLNLIEDFLSKRKVPIPGCDENWARNKNYFRLDGSTSCFEREKLINQFNAPDNNRVHLFLLSTRAGCLGINLIGANRVVVFDASWNPCHDCQAVCRVYRYGQTKKCYVYRLVTDNTMEKKIYDRQINKQGMSDRVVDELNPQHLMTRKQVDVLLQYEDVDLPMLDPERSKDDIRDPLLSSVIQEHHVWITKNPFTHESLLLDRKDEKLTKSEKRLAKQGYEMEKKLSVSYSRPSYASFYPQGRVMEQPMTRHPPRPVKILYPPNMSGRPIASVRPMMSTPVPMRPNSEMGGVPRATLRPGVTIQQVKTTTDITIPGTNTATGSGPAKIPSGENVLVIKTPKGVYIRTGNGKIFAVRTTGTGDGGGGAEESKSGSMADLVSAASASSASSTIPKTQATVSTATATVTSSSCTLTQATSNMKLQESEPNSSVKPAILPPPVEPVPLGSKPDEKDPPSTQSDSQPLCQTAPELATLVQQGDMQPTGDKTDYEPAMINPNFSSPLNLLLGSPKTTPSSDNTLVSTSTLLEGAKSRSVTGSEKKKKKSQNQMKFTKSEPLLSMMMKSQLSEDSSNQSTSDSAASKKGSPWRTSSRDSSPDISVIGSSAQRAMSSGYHPLGSLQNLATGNPPSLGAPPPQFSQFMGGMGGPMAPYGMPSQFPWGMGAMGMPPMWMPPHMSSGGNDYSEPSWWQGSGHTNHTVPSVGNNIENQQMSQASKECENITGIGSNNFNSPNTQNRQLETNSSGQSSGDLGMDFQESSMYRHSNNIANNGQSSHDQMGGHNMMGGPMSYPQYPAYGLPNPQSYQPQHTSHVNSTAASGGSMSYSSYPGMSGGMSAGMPSGMSAGMPPSMPPGMTGNGTMSPMSYPGILPPFNMNFPSSPKLSKDSDQDSSFTE